MNGAFHEYIHKVVLEQKKRREIASLQYTQWGMNAIDESYLGPWPEGMWTREAMQAALDFEKICTEYVTGKINKETAIFNMQSLGLPPLVLTEALDEMYNRRDEYVEQHKGEKHVG